MIAFIKKTMILTVALLALIALPAFAATKLPGYTLVVGGNVVPLSKDTGYIFKSGSTLILPVQAVTDALGLKSELSKDKKTLTITRPGGAKVALKSGTDKLIVDGKTQTLRLRTGSQKGGKLTADIYWLKAFDISVRHIKPGKTAASFGYSGGVLMLSSSGETPQTPGTNPLPSAAREAALTATQIVTVKATGGAAATVKLFELSDGDWSETMSTNAYIGSAGAGKTKEGDKKTPLGTFNLTTPFGILDDPGAKMGGYIKVKKTHYWCATSSSKYYNQLVDTSKVNYSASKSDEHLIDYQGVYDYCLFVDYNASGTSGRGSAIFLHCMGSKTSTGGCIAVPKRVMIKLLETLDEGAKIVIYE